MPSGVPNEFVESSTKQRYCKYCYQPVVRINFTGTAGKGDIRPYKHAYNRSKVNSEQCHRTTLSEKDVVETNPWA